MAGKNELLERAIHTSLHTCYACGNEPVMENHGLFFKSGI